MADLLLLLGGVRSGKSRAAVELARAAAAPVAVLATADPADADLRQRVVAHRAERPADWATYQVQRDPGRLLAGLAQPVVILDCVTVWISNLLLDLETSPDAAVLDGLHAELDGLLAAIEHRTGLVILVSNEVGLGVVPPYPLGRRYRDLLGTTNQRLAAAASDVRFLVAGIPIPIGHFRDHPPA